MYLTLALTLLAGSAHAAPPSSPALGSGVTSRIDSDVKAVLRRLRVPGATIEVVRGDLIVYRRAYGERDLKRRLPAGIDTHYEIGSITKQFTAAAILQLRDAGQVNLDAKVAAYVPNAPHADEITVRQCLTHTSGLPDYLDSPGIERAVSEPATFDQVMALVSGKPLEFAPGADWSYSNTGYAILGRIIEVVSHESYRSYIRAHILDPLGMSQTFTVGDEPSIPAMASGYRHVGGEIERAPIIGEPYAFSAGDLVSTVDDLEKWGIALETGKIVTRADYALMTTEQKTASNVGTGYGFGLFLDALDEQPRVGHTGGSLGFTSADEYFPKQHVRIIALTNDSDGNPEAGEAVANAVFEDLFAQIAARASRPKPGADAAIAGKVRKFFRSMQSGDEDYSTVAPHLAAKLRYGLAKRLAAEFAPYGAPTAITFKGHRVASGLDFSEYDVQFGPGIKLRLGAAFDSSGKIASLSFG